MSNAFGRVVEYQYDVRDRLTNVVDAHGVSTRVVYDTLDRVVRRSVAGGGSEGFLYNARGLIAYTNPLGKVTIAEAGEGLWVLRESAILCVTETSPKSKPKRAWSI